MSTTTTQARDAGFRLALTKTAGVYAGTLMHPDTRRWRRIALAMGLGGVIAGVGAGAAGHKALVDRKKKQ